MALGDLQKEIILTIANSPNPLVVNQIAKILGKDQTTIFKSADLLLKHTILKAERQKNGIRRYLKFTDRGAFIGLETAEVTLTSIIKNHQYVKLPSFVLMLREFYDQYALEGHTSGIFSMINNEPASFDKRGQYVLDQAAKRGIEAIMMYLVLDVILEEAEADESLVTDTQKLLAYAEEAKVILENRTEELLNRVKALQTKTSTRVGSNGLILDGTTNQPDEDDLISATKKAGNEGQSH